MASRGHGQQGHGKLGPSDPGHKPHASLALHQKGEHGGCGGRSRGDPQHELKDIGLLYQALLDEAEAAPDHPGVEDLELGHHPALEHLSSQALEPLGGADVEERAEIHRARVERGYLGVERKRRPPLLLGKVPPGNAARRRALDDIAPLLDGPGDLKEELRVLGPQAGLGVPHVDVDHGGAGPMGGDGLLHYLPGGQRYVGRLLAGVATSGYGRGYDELFHGSHLSRGTRSLTGNPSRG